MPYQSINANNQQTVGQEPAHFIPTNPNQTDSFSSTFDQKCSHEAQNLEHRTLCNSSSGNYFQPHGRHGEPLYRSLLRPHHHAQPSYAKHVDGAHHLHHLCEADNPTAGSCFSQQCAHYNPCRCGSPMLHETNTRREFLSNGYGYHSNRALSNEITLYNWYLIRSDGPRSSDIAVGGFLSSRGTEVERIETVTIVKRLQERKLLTKDGIVINLVGPIDDYRTVSNGFSLQVVQLFMSGFPHIWNLVVGMGLQSKVTGTNLSSRRCDSLAGGIRFQERLEKEAQGQREYMQPFPAFEGLETDLFSSLERETNCGYKHVTEDSPCVEVPESATPPEHSMSLVNGECQSQEGQPFLHNQAQQKAVHDREDKEDTCTKECSQHEGAHGQIKLFSNEAALLVEVTDLASQRDNIHIERMDAPASEIGNVHVESVDAPVSEIDNKQPEFTTATTTENYTKEENHVSLALLVATPDATASAEAAPDANDEADEIYGEDLEMASAQSFQITERELWMAQPDVTACQPPLKRRRIAFNTANQAEGGEPFNVSPSLETFTKGLEVSCSPLSNEGGERNSSVVTTETRKGVVTKKATAKKKAKRRRRGRFVLLRSKRSTKPVVNLKKRVSFAKQRRHSSLEQELDEEFKKNQSKEFVEGQVAIAQQDHITDVTTELVSDSPVVTRVKTRQGVKTKQSKNLFVKKKGIQAKSIAKDSDCFTKLKEASNQASLENLEDHDVSPSGNSLRKGKRRSARGSVLDLQLDTSQQKGPNKPSENRGTLGMEDVSHAPESSKQIHCGETHDGSDPSSMSSARKRSKQMLPPPLPSPLVSVPKHLVSKAFGLKTSKSGRLLVPPLAHWRGQSIVRDMDGGIIAIEDRSQGTPREETGCFNFRPPMEARAKKLQEWLSMTASKCLTKKLNARQKSCRSKTASK